MIQYMKKFIGLIDMKLLKFTVVGLINTAVGTAIMFGLYNIFHFSYWTSSASNYILTSMLSYFLNRYFTFKDSGHIGKSGPRFFINIACCYLLAYGIAKPTTAFVLSRHSAVLQDNVSMVVGMCFFVGLNYFGQRLFVFKNQQA